MSEIVGAERKTERNGPLYRVNGAVSGMREKTEERETGEREWSGEWKFNKLVERGAAF
jgi:hypothetical protein